MSNIQIFNFNSNPVRIELFENQPHFCLLDVCEVFEIKNSRRVQREMLDPQGVRQAYIFAKDEKQRRTSFINEPNLYRIIFRSEKAIAREFQNWVFEEVLPQIRKTGQYSQNNQPNLPLVKEPKFSRELTQKEWLSFASMWFALHNSLEVLSLLGKPLRDIGSPLGSTAHTYSTEYQILLGAMKRQLEPLLAEFEIEPTKEAHYHLALRTLRAYKPKGLGGIVRI